jgi:hypothetical protein
MHNRPGRLRGRVRVLHHLQALLSLPAMARVSSGAAGRRQRQRLAIAQRLLDPLPAGLAARGDGERFWRLLRWGGAGMVLAWLLQR